MRGTYLVLVLGLLFAVGCGDASKNKRSDSPGNADKTAEIADDKNTDDSDSADGNDGAKGSEIPNEVGVPAAPFVNGAIEELTGTYEQVENRQAKLRIDQTYLVITNIELPVPTENGTLRLTPRFPHHLRLSTEQAFFSTLGYFNDGDELWDNVELRIVPQTGTNFIDVTFVLKAPTSSAGSVQNNQGQINNNSQYDPCQATPFCPDPCFNPCPQPCYVFDPCDPCWPLDPCLPLNPCDPCPEDDNDNDNDQDSEGRLLLYRFEKVEAAASLN